MPLQVKGKLYLPTDDPFRRRRISLGLETLLCKSIRIREDHNCCLGCGAHLFPRELSLFYLIPPIHTG